MKKVSIKDVAAAAGVAFSTAAMAMRNNHLICEATRHKVMEAAAKLGYVRNVSAGRLSGGKTNIIGLIVFPTLNPVSAEMIRVVSEVLFKRGFQCKIMVADLSNANAREMVLQSFNGTVDGVISYTIPLEFGGSLAWSKRLESCNIQCVFDHQSKEEVDFVSADFFRAGVIAAEYLIAGKHKNIAISVHSNSTMPDRQEGFIKTLQQAGIEPVVIRNTWKYSEPLPELGKRAVEFLLELPTRPTALFLPSDYVAMGALKAAANAGIIDRLEVIGFDGLEINRYLNPSLKSIGFDRVKQVNAMIDRLQEKMNGTTDEVKQVFIDPFFIADCEKTRSKINPQGELS